MLMSNVYSLPIFIVIQKSLISNVNEYLKQQSYWKGQQR